MFTQQEGQILLAALNNLLKAQEDALSMGVHFSNLGDKVKMMTEDQPAPVEADA